MENKIEIKCHKVKFSSEKFAVEHLERIHKNGKGEKLPVEAYLCRTCGSWHVTSNKSSSYNKLSDLETENKKLKQENHELRISLAKAQKELKNSPKSKLELSKATLEKKVEEHEEMIKQLRNSLNELLRQKLKAESTCQHNNYEWKSDSQGGLLKYCNDCKCYI